MTWRKRTIMEMARDCGINFHQAGWPELERFAEQVREEAQAEEQRYDRWLHVATMLLDRLAEDTAQRLRSVSSTSELVPNLVNRVMVTEESMLDHRRFIDVTFPKRLKEARELVQQFKEALAQPEQDTIQRLSALVRAQQITIDKLEAQRTWIGLSMEQFIYFTHYVKAEDLMEIENALMDNNT